MQKHVILEDLVKSFPTHIYLQNLASIQPRTSPVKFARSSRTAAAPSWSGGAKPAQQWAAGGAQPMVPRGGRSSQGSFSVASKPIKRGKLLENWNFETDIENIILAQGPESRIK